MKKTLISVIIIVAAASLAHAQAKKLPSFNLPDPQGGMHSSSELSVNGLVVIVSAPILHDKTAQEGWAQHLADTKGSKKASLILIEDMSASAFKGMAASSMKKNWKPGIIPILLEDNSGETHAAFGVEKEETKVFVYDKNGNLIHSEAGSPSVETAKTIWIKLPN